MISLPQRPTKTHKDLSFVASYSLPTPHAQDYLSLLRRLIKKLADRLLNAVHTHPVTTIDQRRSSLRLFDKIAVKMRLLVI